MSAFTLTKSKGGGGGVKAPAGNHMAVCVAIVEMGHQEHTYLGKPTAWKRDIYMLWELVGEQIAGTTKNHVIGTALTFSFNENATLTKWVEARTGKTIPEGEGYDVAQELGQPCLLNVKMKGDWPRIEGVAPLPKGLPCPKPTYPLTLLTLDDIRAGKDVPEFVPWHMGNPLIDHIKASKELGGPKPQRKPKDQAGAASEYVAPGPADPIPF